MTPLPTVDEVRSFVDKINDGREALGLDRIDRVDFDACDPDSSHNCLSARHLFRDRGREAGWVGSDEFFVRDTHDRESLASALGVKVNPDHSEGILIPPEIKVVTDAFDHIVPGLRDVFVEAGLVVD